MLYHIGTYLKYYFFMFNVVQYVSFRAMAALLTSLISYFLYGQSFITMSRRFFRSPRRQWTPKHHHVKDNMPSMGGVFIVAVVILNTLLWCNLTRSLVWIALVCIAAFAVVGFVDDWYKITRHRGIAARHKFLLQCLIAMVTSFALQHAGLSTRLTIPFFKWFAPTLGSFFIPWAIFILVGCSNAVNLTDGLDGLAITSLIPNFATLSIICYLAGNQIVANYLYIPFAGSAELAILGATFVGASLGFLWYNAYPAQIFMGDVGSLALGSGLALMALCCKQELLLALSGGLFVAEALSVIVQITSYKLFGTRVFKMAPIHHHFELLGWQEPKITIRFGIISLILCLLALMTIKMR